MRATGALPVVVAMLVAAGVLSAAHAQNAPGHAVVGPLLPADPLEGRIVRQIRIGPSVRPSTTYVVRRHLASREGAPFLRANVLEDRRRLDALRLFSGIEIRAVAEGDAVDLEVDLRETLRILPFVALSVTEENGASAGPAFRGISLLGRGWLSSGTWQFGGATAVGARLERPTVTPGAWDVDLRGLYRTRRNELFDFDERSVTAAGSAGWNWTNHVQVGGRAEWLQLETGTSDTSLSSTGTDSLPTVGLSATYNAIDSQSNPRVGWLASAEVARLFGDARSWALTLEGRRHQPLTARSALSVVTFATWQSGVVGRDLPEYSQFGLGGTNSVRGWDLGSRIGKHQAIATAEYTYAIVPVRPFTIFGLNLYGGIQAAVFSDVGLAWTDVAAASDAIDGYGVGLRLLLPFVDVLRLDVAFGQPGEGARLCLGISLKADKQRERVR